MRRFKHTYSLLVRNPIHLHYHTNSKEKFHVRRNTEAIKRTKINVSFSMLPIPSPSPQEHPGRPAGGLSADRGQHQQPGRGRACVRPEVHLRNADQQLFQSLRLRRALHAALHVRLSGWTLVVSVDIAFFFLLLLLSIFIVFYLVFILSFVLVVVLW